MDNKIYSIFLAGAAIVALAGCEKEASFLLNEGQLNGKAVSVDYINSGTRASNINIGDFTVNFVNTKTNEVEKSFTYSEMPEMVTLPIGEYRAEAQYGENKIAEWENPFYNGSTSFSIEAGKITEHVDPIECELKNIKVEVDVLDETGFDIIGDDIQVVVNAGKSGELTYDSEHLDSIGYFRYDNGSNTIIAELSGTIDGLYTEGVRRIYDNANAGNYYRIRFHINRPDNTNPGDIQIGEGISVDATIEIKDENHIINPNEPDIPIIDDMRPVEETGTKPDPGKDPGNDPEPTYSPEILPEGFELGEPYHIGPTSSCVVNLISHAENGIQKFCIDIESPSITDDLLADVNLASHMDLTDPGELRDGLNHPIDEETGLPNEEAGLGLPVEFVGDKEVRLDVSKFMGILYMVGQGETHTFHLTLKDENGTVNKDIIVVADL